MAVRPIDANALKQAIVVDFYEHYTKYHDSDQKALIEMILDDIDEIPTLTPPNDPLTLEQLREMDGRPVWTVTTGLKGSGRWELVCDVDYEDVLEMASCVDGFYHIEVNTYGSTWIAYRRPPEGEP